MLSIRAPASIPIHWPVPLTCIVSCPQVLGSAGSLVHHREAKHRREEQLACQSDGVFHTSLPRICTLILLASICPAAWATGREMEGIALAVRLLPFLAAFVLVTAVVVVYLLSPKSWPRVKRWVVAAVVGPAVVVVLILVSVGANLLRLQLARMLLP